ncbi:RluA family pseudouridine synthase [Leptolyngbya sp. 7M]|uniref:RluA family pseudouridine synthase n=1 Tax=Leptolyngbya sp. 7M TaxID=2812896 RepID=UPI0021F2335A|nr:RluA family pseudouridine synthase [Leptolyngbya sp. 7M]
MDKPTGLLSVPGRYGDRQDSILSRLQQSIQQSVQQSIQQSNGAAIQAVHRLDQETSGILLLARDARTQRQLSQQFQQRTVRKVYEAVLAGRVTKQAGVIDLPLWGNPADRPRQQVNWQHGKPSQTQFRVLSSHENLTRVEFIPITGRTHQLRVHAAEGLGVPIWGDRLYGCELPAHPLPADRLHLHARELRVYHPQSGQLIQLYSSTPF